jgi:hypothetical protein
VRGVRARNEANAATLAAREQSLAEEVGASPSPSPNPNPNPNP